MKKNMKKYLLVLVIISIIAGIYSYINVENREEQINRIKKQLNIYKLDIIKEAEASLYIKNKRVEELKQSLHSERIEKFKLEQCIKFNSGSLNKITEFIECDNFNIIETQPTDSKEWLVNNKGLSQDKFILSESNTIQRMNQLLIRFGKKVDVDKKRWERVGKKYGIKPVALVCIAKADSSLGKNLKSTYNFGNVGNNDRGDTRHFNSAIEGINAIGKVLNNKYLSYKQSIGSLSVGGGGSAPFYATSPENWNNNIINCLREVYNDYSINENFNFRI